MTEWRNLSKNVLNHHR